MQLVFLAGLLFYASTLFEGFNLAKQLFSLLTIYNLFLDGFFCLSIQTTNGSNNVVPYLIKGQTL